MHYHSVVNKRRKETPRIRVKTNVETRVAAHEETAEEIKASPAELRAEMPNGEFSSKQEMSESSSMENRMISPREVNTLRPYYTNESSHEVQNMESPKGVNVSRTDYLASGITKAGPSYSKLTGNTTMLSLEMENISDLGKSMRKER